MHSQNHFKFRKSILLDMKYMTFLPSNYFYFKYLFIWQTFNWVQGNTGSNIYIVRFVLYIRCKINDSICST